MNAKMIEALKGIRDNLSVIIDEAENTGSVVTKAEKVVAPKETETVAPKSRKEREASEELPDVTGNLTEEQLNSLSYNNLKKLAKEMGISATGARDELTQKILNVEVSVDAEDDSDEETVEAPKTAPSKVAKNPVIEESDDDDDEEEVDPIVEQVNEAVAEMTDEEIMDVLADVGVKAKGKRQALISAVIKAVREGKIDLEDDDEEESEDVSPSEDSVEEDGFDVNDLDNPDMTKERKVALESFATSTATDFENGDITREQIVEWLNDFHSTKDTMKKKSDEELLNEYVYYASLFINDEGEMPEEEGAYTVNDVPYCCGHELAYNEDNETYICEVCGGEYEAGE